MLYLRLIWWDFCRSSFQSETRIVYLDKVTRIDAAAYFFAQEHVPKRAITMGLQTIMKVRQFTDAFFPYLRGQAVTCSGAQLANFQIEMGFKN